MANGAGTIDILGVKISRLGQQQAVAACREARGYVCFANAHSLSESKKSAPVREALCCATYAVADGVPLIWVSKLKGKPIASRVCGPDFVREFLKVNRAETHGFIGGAPGQAQKLAESFGLKATCYSPPMREFSPAHASDDWERFLDQCPGRKPPRYIWVGLGAPKQELWMHIVSKLAPDVLFFGVGAAFDFLTGSKARAPQWMQSFGLEWLFRLVQEPGRLWRRYLIGNSAFVLFSLLELLPPLWIVLAVQLIVAIFVPAFAYGSRSLFLGDIGFFIWPAFYMAQIAVNDPSKRGFLGRFAWVSTALFGLIYVHGYFRVSLADELALVNMPLNESDRFNAFRELIVGGRFLSWLWAGVAVANYPFGARDLRRIHGVLTWVLLAASAVMFACKLSPDLSTWMGSVYGYDANYWGWAGRIYGVFRSPNEAGVFFGLGLVSFLEAWRRSEKRGRLFYFFVLTSCLMSVAFAQSMTTLITFVGLILNSLLWRLKGKVRWGVVTVGLLSSVACAVTAINYSHFFLIKYDNFIYRIGPWQIFWKMALTRWDLFLLGLGWTGYHSDNAYFFIFNRGGILLLLSALLFLAWPINGKWRSWSIWSKNVVAFLFLSSFSVDSIILRPLVALLVCAVLAQNFFVDAHQR